MSLLVEVLNWGIGLSPWQSDAMRRLFSKLPLATDDLDDLYALLKSEQGIEDPKERVPLPLSADDVPSGAESKLDVKLLAIKDLIGVNAIAENQALAFAQKGLTVIYGDNGSGKSGYSRVLKKACRARDQNEPIRPNANSSVKKGAAKATFEASVDGSVSQLVWEDGKVAPVQLSNLSIFDARCARAYLDDEDDFSYVPYGLDIVEGLADICRDFQGRIRDEQVHCAVDKTVFGDLNQSNTAVGALIRGLSAKTDVAVVEKLATLTTDEVARHGELGKSLKADNPKEKAKQLKSRAARVRKLSISASARIAIVNNDELKNLKDLSEAYHLAKSAAELAAKDFEQNESLLPATGGDAWKELYEAARKFSLEAYSGKDIAALGAQDPCPLCQEPLNDGAARLASFDAFVRNETAEAMINARKLLGAKYKPFENAKMALDFDDILFNEITDLNKDVAVATREFEGALLKRQKAMVSACANRDWDSVPALPDSPVKQLEALSAALDQEADDLEKAADEAARAALQKEFDELDARQAISKLKELVLTAIGKYSVAAKLSKCATAVKTNSITKKTNELAEKIVNKELADALNAEFQALGANNLHVSLDTRAVKGKTLHKLKLELPNAVNPAEILSEGEQRAIAIGSFLAEVKMSSNAGGIIFDDPVSSLDHRRREYVAERLVGEALDRQVVVFTHDVYFLCVLMESAARKSVPVEAQSLTRRPEGFGVAISDLPFEGMGTRARVKALRARHQCINAHFNKGNEEEFRKETIDCYRQLRLAWERAVEEVLFQGVVLRFRKGVETSRLISVVVEDEDYQLIEESMSKCSNYAHDQALMGGTAIPMPDELLKDVEQLDAWRLAVDDRTKKVQKQRKAGS